MKLIVIITLLLAVALPALARDRGQVRAFRRTHPCPATGKAAGSCPGWVVDHVVPLCLGGADHPVNMQWQEREASLKKDIEERRACRMNTKAENR